MFFFLLFPRIPFDLSDLSVDSKKLSLIFQPFILDKSNCFLLYHSVTMVLENTTPPERAVLTVNDVGGTKLDANNNDNDEDEATTSPSDSYVSYRSTKENISVNDEKRSVEHELIILPMPADKKTKTIETPSLETMTLSDLRKECIMRGLKVGGTKLAILERLRNPAEAAASRHGDGFSSERVDAALKVAGYETPEKASLCVKVAIQKELILLRYGLNQIMAKWECVQCHKGVEATLQHCLDQPDFGGHDDRDGNLRGALRCQDCKIGRYVSNVCNGGFEVTTGKSHNHCVKCVGLGKCLGDYREIHCDECHGHFFTGLSGFPCPCVERLGDMTGMLCGMGTAEAAGLMFQGLLEDEHWEINHNAHISSFLEDVEKYDEVSDLEVKQSKPYPE